MAEHKDTPVSDKKRWLVRTLLILGIGIPVFIEVFTFSGLVSSHLFGDDKGQNAVEEQEADSNRIPQLQRGDTLFSGTAFPVSLKDMKLHIYPDHWTFMLQVTPVDHVFNRSDSVRLEIKQLSTQNNKTVKKGQRIAAWTDSVMTERKLKWRLESGQRPQRIDLELHYSSPGSKGPSFKQVSLEFGHIPARYMR